MPQVAASSQPETSYLVASPSLIVPRWEWRMFGLLPPRARGTAGIWAKKTPDELYLLSPHTPHNVKVRAGRLQVKHLDRINGDGFEQWRPVLDVPFPVSAAQLPLMCRALALPMFGDPHRTYTQTELFSAALEQDRNLSIVPVRKIRTPMAAGQWRGEHVTVTAADTYWYSLAFESENPAIVYSMLRRFGLEHTANTSYPVLLKRIAGGSPSSTRVFHSLLVSQEDR